MGRKMATPDQQRDCEHGQLALACDRCADAWEIAALNAALTMYCNALTRKSDRLQELWRERDEARAEVERLQRICEALHDRLLRGDQDRELLALVAGAWRHKAEVTGTARRAGSGGLPR